VNEYLEKHSFKDRIFTNPPSADTFLIVVIPCHDEPDLISTLISLKDCEPTQSTVEVIVVVNSGEEDAPNIFEQNSKTIAEAAGWIKKQDVLTIKFHLAQVNDLPQRHAGVGLARKIGMDEAVRRFEDINRHDGIIVCLDADCTVEKNYLKQLEKHFQWDADTPACSIYFEHPIEGTEYSKENYEGIINYELFLRYYCLGLRYCGFPYPSQTIGSSMAVRSSAYQKQGGMNRRKAGEDFYFLHKIFPLGHFTNLNTTTVYPSPRPSHRVPFGTGSAMQKYLSSHRGDYRVYSLQTFFVLKDFFAMIPSLYHNNPKTEMLHPGIREFLGERNFPDKLKELRQHSASEQMFVKRFFNWFDGFLVLKFMHFCRENWFMDMGVRSAAIELMKVNGHSISTDATTKEVLLEYRKEERSGYSGLL
jgi:glycosyltransferase involved in cell wall biosynthesis